MSPLEYCLFAMNMVFLIDYSLSQATASDIYKYFPEESLPILIATEERELALQIMAMID
jgi:hypothetical protein